MRFDYVFSLCYEFIFVRFDADWDAAIVRVSVNVFRLNLKNEFSLSLMLKDWVIVWECCISVMISAPECGVTKLMLTVSKLVLLLLFM